MGDLGAGPLDLGSQRVDGGPGRPDSTGGPDAQLPPPDLPATPRCGDGWLDTGESCDDHNERSDDGCSAGCEREAGWVCPVVGLPCRPLCGDGLLRGSEECDDGANEPDDGCTATCALVPGWVCPEPGAACLPDCGDGLLTGSEQCDDGDQLPGDGCSAGCVPEPGWTCPEGVAGACAPICGDGRRVGPEGCDDGGVEPADGCSPGCMVEPFYACDGEPSECVCVVYVDGRPVPGHRDGATWQRALAGPREGLAAAAAGCDVWLAQGHYPVQPALGPLQVPAGVALCGSFEGHETRRGYRHWRSHPSVLDGLDPATNERVDRVVVLEGVEGVRLEGLVITNGSARLDGGGLWIGRSTEVVVYGCSFVGNFAARFGGGLYADGSELRVQLSSFEDNLAQEGGGVSLDGGTSAVIARTRLVGNTATVRGGGLRLFNRSSLQGVDLLIAHNQAEQRYGGGLLSWDATRLVLVGSTLAGNSAGMGAGALRTYNAELARLANCVVWDNLPDAFDDVGVNVEATFCDLQAPGLPGEGNLSADPLFAAPDDFELAAGSPCIDVGSDAAASLADLEQRPRVDVPGVGTPGVAVDLGAFEHQPRESLASH